MRARPKPTVGLHLIKLHLQHHSAIGRGTMVFRATLHFLELIFNQRTAPFLSSRPNRLDMANRGCSLWLIVQLYVKSGFYLRLWNQIVGKTWRSLSHRLWLQDLISTPNIWHCFVVRIQRNFKIEYRNQDQFTPNSPTNDRRRRKWTICYTK